MKHLLSIVMAGTAFVAGSATAQARPAETQKRPPMAATPAARRDAPGQAKREAGEEHERTLTAAQVPAAVRAAITREWPNAQVSKWSSEVEDGKTMYEAETTDGAAHRDVMITAAGRIQEIETQVTMTQVPAAVRAAATANNARVERAEMVVAGRDTTYEFKITGRTGELKLRANGTALPAERH
jgi:uncharacterized membrane protein YkoI